MAFSVEDLGDFRALLRQHPEWRDAVRREVLTHELLELPIVVGRLAEAQDRIATDLSTLVGEGDRLVAQMRELGQIVGRFDGRVGNLDGWRHEQAFNARARSTEILRRPVEVNLAELDSVLDARDSGRLSEREWKQLLALDFLFRGQFGTSPGAPERFLALEVWQVVDSRDVQRAHDRASILGRLGLEAIAAVGRSRVTRDAAELAWRLGVRTLIDSADDS